MAEELLVCTLAEEYPEACLGLPNYEHEQKRYCILHFPVDDKEADFEAALSEKLANKDFDFEGVFFPKVFLQFRNFQFDTHARFRRATFGEVHFSKATFIETADFIEATFGDVTNFDEATFNKRVDFDKATFGEVYFREATFNEEVYFIEATFGDVADFYRATFGDVATFTRLRSSPETLLVFAGATIARPERISFYTTHLRPSGFVDVDAHEFDFSDVEWFRIPSASEPYAEKLQRLKLEDEVKAIIELLRQSQQDKSYKRLRKESLRKLQKACRRLMKNAEENRDYATANEFHYWSMVLARKEAMVLAREKSFREALRQFGLIEALYGALSGYGERPWRAFLVLVGMGTLFAILYVMMAGSIEHVGHAFLYSLAAIVRLTGVPAMAPLTKLLQPSEPGLFQFLVTAEGILGPLQIALLALAVRRRVMR